MKRLSMIVAMTLLSFPLGAFIYWSSTCACEKDPTGHFAALNPFRDRGPEHVAGRFFQELSTGQCQPDHEVFCRPALKHGRVTAWMLSARETKEGMVSLVYNVEYDAGGSGPTLVGIALQSTDGASWRILGYTANEWN